MSARFPLSIDASEQLSSMHSSEKQGQSLVELSILLSLVMFSLWEKKKFCNYCMYMYHAVPCMKIISYIVIKISNSPLKMIIGGSVLPDAVHGNTIVSFLHQ